MGASSILAFSGSLLLAALAFGVLIGLAGGFVFWPWLLRGPLGRKLAKKYQAPALPSERFGTQDMRNEAIKALGKGARYEESSDGRVTALLVTHPKYQSIHSRVPCGQLPRARQAMVARLRDADFVRKAAKK